MTDIVEILSGGVSDIGAVDAVASFVQGPPGGGGASAWTPVMAVVADGARSVQRIIDWTGGTGAKPGLGYLGASGIVATAAEATDIRGGAGSSAWNPVIAVEVDSARRVHRIIDWTGGTGVKPGLGYLGPAGIVATAAEATDIRGAAGGNGLNGAPGVGAAHYAVPAAAGSYISPLINAAALTTIAGAALRCDWQAFIPSRLVPLDRLGVEVTTLLAGSTALVGIYADAAGGPGALLSGGGALLDCATIGLKEETIAASLVGGTVYWLAVATSGTQQLRAAGVGSMLPLSVNPANGSPFNVRRATLSSMALPAMAPATTLTSATVPLIRMRVAV